jgi:hypothetical protein
MEKASEKSTTGRIIKNSLVVVIVMRVGSQKQSFAFAPTTDKKERHFRWLKSSRQRGKHRKTRDKETKPFILR